MWLEKFEFLESAISSLSTIAKAFNFYTVLITNQDGLGAESYPLETFEPYQNQMLKTLAGEGFFFNEICIDDSFEKDNKNTRKPNVGLVNHLLNNPSFNIENSYVIGDRWSDIQLAKNIGCKAIYLQSFPFCKKLKP